MAKLLAHGSDDGTKGIEALDTVDLEAISLARAWSVSSNGYVERVRPTPCPRRDCGGSVLLWGRGERCCILCARSGGGNGFYGEELPELTI